jgi:hypothetical protein
MMIMPNPSVLEHFHAERQRRFRPNPALKSMTAAAPGHLGFRVRIGHALIGAGTAIAGERTESAGHTAQPRAI